MRVIAGNLSGRQFDAPDGDRTHPMSDKVRGALFNTLGDIEGLSVLDAFAGSGALAFEAISRGAALAIAVESSRSAQRAIDGNILTLGLSGQVKLIKASASAWLQTSPEKVFNIVLCDPPYDDLQTDLLASLATRVETSGLFVLSWPGKREAPDFVGLELVVQHNYGDAQLVFYRRIA